MVNFSYWLVVMLRMSSFSSLDPTAGRYSFLYSLPTFVGGFTIGFSVSTSKDRLPTLKVVFAVIVGGDKEVPASSVDVIACSRSRTTSLLRRLALGNKPSGGQAC